MLGRALAPAPSSPGLNVPLASDSKRAPPRSAAPLEYTEGEGEEREEEEEKREGG